MHRANPSIALQDPALPGLKEALQPQRVLEELVERGLAETPFGGALPIVELLQHRPGSRCVVRYRASPGAGGLDLVGKAFSSPGRARRAEARLRRVHDGLSERGVAAPRPLGVVERWNVLLMEFVRGEPLTGSLRVDASLAHRLDAAARAGSALAALHQIPSTGRAKIHGPGELERCRRRLAGIEPSAPELAGRVRGILDALEPALATPPRSERTLVHGDFTEHQLLVEGDRIGMVDLDGVKRGDPAVDLGKFLMRVGRLEPPVDGEGSGPEARRFLEAYLRERPGGTVIDRVPAFLALARVRQALRHLERARPGQEARSLRRAEKLLEEATPRRRLRGETP